MKRTLLLFVFLLLGSTAWAQGQDLIHYWNFNDPSDSGDPWPSPVAATQGNGTLSYTFDAGYVKDFGGTTENTQDGDPAGDSFVVQGGSSEINNGRHLELHLSTVGYEGIAITYATQGTSTGFDEQTVSYSTDGGATFTTHSTVSPPSSYTLRSIDLTSIDGADDNADLVVRITLDGATSSSGNNRFDNITVFGTPLPVGPVTNITQGTSYAAIQAAVDAADAGDVIEVAAGTFEEQVVIDRDGLTIRGAGSGSDPAIHTIIRAPESLAYAFAAGAGDNHPVVGITGATGVTLRDVRVDGAGRGNDNNRFVGVGLWNAGGTIENSVITGVRETPFSGGQHGVGIYANNDTGGPYAIRVSGTTVDDFQKNGMAFSGSGLTVDVDGNTVTGVGVTDALGQNGIQVGYGATGAITQNAVSGIAYDGPTYAAAGILVFDADATTMVEDNTVEGTQVGLWFYNNSAEIAGNDVAAPATVGVGSWGAILDPVEDVGMSEPAPFDADADGGAARASQKASASVSYTFDDNALVGADAEGSTGLEIYSGSETVGVTGTGNLIKDFDIGVFVNEAADGLVESVALSENCIVSNETMGLANHAALTVDATGNWWGSAAGPGTGSANGVDGPVAADPFATDPVSDIEGCGGASERCPASDFTESVVSNTPPGEVQITISDAEGIDQVRFYEVANFTIASEADDFTDQGEGIWTPNASGDTEASFTLTQADVGIPDASYFAQVTNGCGTITDIDPVHALEAKPDAFTLEGNYPNPFRTQTTLRFALPETADVTLSVYDVMGRKVATLVEGALPAGTHDVAWQGRGRDGQTLASGVYFVRLQAGDRTAAHRLTLVR